MTALDLLLLLMLAGSAFGGYRRGALAQGAGLVGLAAGGAAGIGVARGLASRPDEPGASIVLVLFIVLGLAVLGSAVAAALADRLVRRIGRGASIVDRVLGAGVSVLAGILAIWFCALNLAAGPFPSVARAVRDSRVVDAVAAVLPAPPPLVPQLERVVDALGFPDVFVGVPSTAQPVPPPADPTVAAAVRAASPSLVQVLADGCRPGYWNEGSGFAVAAGYVVTSAHIVAGADDVWARPGGAGDALDATVVAFDPGLDLALLRVPELAAPPLDLATEPLPRGTGGAVLGFPAGGGPTSGPAAVRRLFEPLGRDIYGGELVRRRVYELQARVRGGNSGGPFALPDGRVAGVVFANSVLDDRIAYAIAASQVARFVEPALGRSAPVGLGACVD